MSDDAPLIHLVDDDDGFRAGFGMNLQAEGFRVCAYASVEAFVAQVLWPLRGVVSLDIDFLPGRMGGLQAFDRLLAERASMPVVFLTGPHDRDLRLAVSLVTRRDDVDFFPKHPTADAGQAGDGPLLDALRRLAAREPAAWAAAEDDRRVLQCVLDELTPAERQVLGFLVRDRGIKSFAIADELGKTEGVIELQRQSGQRKLLGDGRSRPSVAERVGPAMARLGAADLQDLAAREFRRRLALLTATERAVLVALASGHSPLRVARAVELAEGLERQAEAEQCIRPLLERALRLVQADRVAQVRRWFLSTEGQVADPLAGADGVSV